jgi:hypothetical protein
MHRWIIIGLALLLAAFGVTEGNDGIVAWVFDIVGNHPLTDIWQPVYNPEPMDTYAYRPLSVVLLKVAAALLGDHTMVWTAVHSLILVAYGLVSRRFLVLHGCREVAATLATLGAMTMPSILFSSWIPVEFDVVGATLVLAAANMLHTVETDGTRGSWLRFGLLAFCALTIKETSALQLLAYLVAFAAMRHQDKRWWRLVGGYLVVLLLLTAPLHWVDGQNSTDFHVLSDDFRAMHAPTMLFHTASQLVFLLSAVGVVAFAAHALRTFSMSSAFRGWAVVALLAALFAVVPVMRHYSHFESVVFDHWVWALALVVLLLVSAVLLVRPRENAGGMDRTATLMVLLTVFGFAAAPLLLPFARADVSARIFAACVPVVHAVVWMEVITLWGEGVRPARAGAVVMSGLMALFYCSSAFNAVSLHRVRMATPLPAKQTLAAAVQTTCPSLLTVNPVQVMTASELRSMGASTLDMDVGVEQLYPEVPNDVGLDAFLKDLGVEAGREAFLYVETPRCRLDSAGCAGLRGDFRWARAWMPEAEDGLYDQYQDMVYAESIPLEGVFQRDGLVLAQEAATYYQFPLWWNEVPRRWIRGIPMVERYEYVARAYYRGVPAGVSPVEGPCRRRDSGAHRTRGSVD